jgi:hypothetical protein
MSQMPVVCPILGALKESKLALLAVTFKVGF